MVGVTKTGLKGSSIGRLRISSLDGERLEGGIWEILMDFCNLQHKRSFSRILPDLFQIIQNADSLGERTGGGEACAISCMPLFRQPAQKPKQSFLIFCLLPQFHLLLTISSHSQIL